jgi:hypothetical protein
MIPARELPGRWRQRLRCIHTDDGSLRNSLLGVPTPESIHSLVSKRALSAEIISMTVESGLLVGHFQWLFEWILAFAEMTGISKGIPFQMTPTPQPKIYLLDLKPSI